MLDIKSLLVIFENKLIRAWQYDTELGTDEYGSHTNRKCQELHEEADAARKNLMDAINELTNKFAQSSWETNPDRMGGQFTTEEIERSQNGTWI